MTRENAITAESEDFQSAGVVRRSIPVLALLFLLIHGFVSTCLPERLAPLSTFCIVLAEMGAIVACLRTSKVVASPTRVAWLLLAASILFHSTAMSLDVVSEATGIPVFNHLPGLSIFFSMLSGVPLLAAISMQFDKRIRGVAGVTNTLLCFGIGTLLYVQILSRLSLHGSTNPADAVLILRLFDGIDFFLAAAATVRWCGSKNAPERVFYRIATFFLWINAASMAIHNRMLIRHDYVWLDLFVSGPYIVLGALIATAGRDSALPASARVVRMVESGSAIFLSISLTVIAVITARTHLYLGLAASLLAIGCYAALSTVSQSRVREAERSLQASKEALEKLVGIDGLTGIPNRWAFDKMLKRECSHGRRTILPVSLLMIDVDHFKQLNDAYGHQIGDGCLMRIAGALRVALPRATDFVARYGGDEFVAILPATDSVGATAIAKRICQAINHLSLPNPISAVGNVTVTVGFSTYDGMLDRSSTNLFQAADRALFEAKRRGRNRCEFLPIDPVPVHEELPPWPCSPSLR